MDFTEIRGKLDEAEKHVKNGQISKAEKKIKRASEELAGYEGDVAKEFVSKDKFDTGVEQFLGTDSDSVRLSILDRLYDFVDNMQSR